MKTVITYGTYDLLHAGHIRLLERAKALGDYLIVGVTSDEFDHVRGKINVQQRLMERIEAVKATGIADKIIVEEYEGQKIEDIQRYHVDIFTVGSDWIGKFDYLNQYCKVVYLPRTEGISSTQIRRKNSSLSLGLLCSSKEKEIISQECSSINGLQVSNNLDICNALYINLPPGQHYVAIRQALREKKHVLYVPPAAASLTMAKQLPALAADNHCILCEAIPFAYATIYQRMLLLFKSMRIGVLNTLTIECSGVAVSDLLPAALLATVQMMGTSDLKAQVTVIPDGIQIEISDKKSKAFLQLFPSHPIGGEFTAIGTSGSLSISSPWWLADTFLLQNGYPLVSRHYSYHDAGGPQRRELRFFTKWIQTGDCISGISPVESSAIMQLLATICEQISY